MYLNDYHTILNVHKQGCKKDTDMFCTGKETQNRGQNLIIVAILLILYTRNVTSYGNRIMINNKLMNRIQRHTDPNNCLSQYSLNRKKSPSYGNGALTKSQKNVSALFLLNDNPNEL